MQVRRAIAVTGIVQGVGFRPYVYRLASQRRLSGHVVNTPSGVEIEIQGVAEDVADFLSHLPHDAPPLARIVGLTVREEAVSGDGEFRILASRHGQSPRTLISPDIAICSDCLRELFDPADRRYRYPFINCTNCGPRFTIVGGIPYDRPLTSMAEFAMCRECREEYENPLDRRFHAQPNACWECGPRVELWARDGRPVKVADAIAAAAERLGEGQVVAVKGLGGFHLAADAANREAVERLRERKRRVDKPFAIMAASLEVIEEVCEMDATARTTLTLMQRPIVLLRKKLGIPIAEAVAPYQRTLGVFLPYTPLHHLLFATAGFRALVMTSGNVSEEPIAIDNQEAVQRLQGLADCFLVHDRTILVRCDDSVVQVVGGSVRPWRRSRGYVPVPVFLHRELSPVLAVGGELKNTICLARGREAFLSQHIGDLENLEANGFFQDAIAHLEQILQIKPEVIAYDPHPDYFSTRWAVAQRDVRLVAVQHHHAHVASCMLENGLDGPVIGFAMDGTGYGSDGNVWGGEVLLADYSGFRRAAHLAYVPMPGGAVAIREPWRMGAACLWRHYGRQFVEEHPLLLRQVPREHLQIVLRMLERGIHSPLTSSCGRLFDAVAALSGVRHRVNYEAQAAIELEMCMESAARGAYRFAHRGEGFPWQIDTQPMFDELITDVLGGVSPGVISLRFHRGLVNILLEVAEKLRASTGVKQVCLSGGSFQNAFLAERLEKGLRQQGFQVFVHSKVPPGDGGLSLGQAAVASACEGRCG